MGGFLSRSAAGTGIYRMIYKSTLNASDSAEAEEIIEAVLKTALAFNPTAQIGGALYCNTATDA